MCLMLVLFPQLMKSPIVLCVCRTLVQNESVSSMSGEC